ncbi:MAG TPA: polysaccharide biosynthesis/export family protein [Nitrospirota bacterium]|nr:polysaccharide biosynthesis/export family protein [Nitrospirota bacterium]
MARTILALLMVGLLGVSIPALTEGSSESAPSPTATSVEQGYQIGPGDVLDISVWKDDALTRSCVVRPDGFISFPLIGDIPASGKTVFELKSEMEGKLKRFVPTVVLYIDVKQINSLVIYVIGKVNNPGRFFMVVDVDVLQALATAGGLNAFAKGTKIRILRHGKNETTIFPFDYDEVVNGKHLEQNIHLRRGDVVVVP